MQETKTKSQKKLQVHREKFIAYEFRKILDAGNVYEAMQDVLSLMESGTFDWSNEKHRARLDYARSIMMTIAAAEEDIFHILLTGSDAEIKREEEQ